MFPLQKGKCNIFSTVMSDLPLIRTECLIPPLPNTGVDLLGPIFMNHRRARIKNRDCLFTHLNTRTITWKLLRV